MTAIVVPAQVATGSCKVRSVIGARDPRLRGDDEMEETRRRVLQVAFAAILDLAAGGGADPDRG